MSPAYFRRITKRSTVIMGGNQKCMYIARHPAKGSIYKTVWLLSNILTTWCWCTTGKVSLRIRDNPPSRKNYTTGQLACPFSWLKTSANWTCFTPWPELVSCVRLTLTQEEAPLSINKLINQQTIYSYCCVLSPDTCWQIPGSTFLLALDSDTSVSQQKMALACHFYVI